MKIYKSGNYSELTITDLCVLKKDSVFTNCVFEKIDSNSLFEKNIIFQECIFKECDGLFFSDSDFTDCQFLNNETLSFTNIKNISDSVISSCEQILLHNEVFIEDSIIDVGNIFVASFNPSDRVLVKIVSSQITCSFSAMDSSNLFFYKTSFFNNGKEKKESVFNSNSVFIDCGFSTENMVVKFNNSKAVGSLVFSNECSKYNNFSGLLNLNGVILCDIEDISDLGKDFSVNLYGKSIKKAILFRYEKITNENVYMFVIYNDDSKVLVDYNFFSKVNSYDDLNKVNYSSFVCDYRYRNPIIRLPEDMEYNRLNDFLTQRFSNIIIDEMDYCSSIVRMACLN